MEDAPRHDEFDRVLSDRDVTNLPEFHEVGCANESDVSDKENCDNVIENESVNSEKDVSLKSSEEIEDAADEIPADEYEDSNTDSNSDSNESSDEEEDEEETVPGNSKNRKRKHENKDVHDSSMEFYEELKNDVRKSRENPKKAKKCKPKNFQEQLLDMQKQQIEVFERSERRFQNFQKTMFKK